MNKAETNSFRMMRLPDPAPTGTAEEMVLADLQPANRDHGDSSFRYGDSGTAAGRVLQMAQRTGLLAKIGPDYILPTTPAAVTLARVASDSLGS
jgi:hypothetical protein